MASFTDVLRMANGTSRAAERFRENQSSMTLALVRAEKLTFLDVLCLSHVCKDAHRLLKSVVEELYAHVCVGMHVPGVRGVAAYACAVAYAQLVQCQRCSHAKPVSSALPHGARLCQRCVYQTGLSLGYPMHTDESMIDMNCYAMLPNVTRMIQLSEVPSSVPPLNTRGKMLQAVAVIDDIARYRKDGTPDDTDGKYYWLPDLLFAALSSRGKRFGQGKVRVPSPLASFSPYNSQAFYLRSLAKDEETPKQRKRKAQIASLREDLAKRCRQLPDMHTPVPYSASGEHLPPRVRRSAKYRARVGLIEKPEDEARRRLMFERARSLAFYDNLDSP